MKRLFLTFLCMVATVGMFAQSLRCYEYWVDSDYGNRTFVNSSNTNISLSISTNAQSTGVHALNFRAQNSNGEWSPVNRMLYVIPEEAELVAETNVVEYWMDDDFSTHRSESVNVVDNMIMLGITISRLSEGTHTLNIRAGNSNGEWSSISRLLFYVPEFPDTGDDEWLRGDVNLDGKVNGTDMVALVNVIMGQRDYFNADVNDDGKVNGTDIVALVNIIMKASENH